MITLIMGIALCACLFLCRGDIAAIAAECRTMALRQPQGAVVYVIGLFAFAGLFWLVWAGLPA